MADISTAASATDEDGAAVAEEEGTEEAEVEGATRAYKKMTQTMKTRTLIGMTTAVVIDNIPADEHGIQSVPPRARKYPLEHFSQRFPVCPTSH